MKCGGPIIVIRCKNASGSQNPSNLGQSRSWLHPVERLSACDNISTFIWQACLVSKPFSILNMCRRGMVLHLVDSFLAHVGVGFDSNHSLGSFAPDSGG